MFSLHHYGTFDPLQLVDSVQERREIADRLDRAASFDVDVDCEIVVGEEK